METISIKLDENIARDIDEAMKKHRYTTKTEFIREAIRKQLSDLDKEDLKKYVASLRGFSKRKTTDEDLHRIREKLADEYEKRFK
ncbi:ribbon-helix-helix protein, CopG family [Candidatus Woesearchaeota archaeon]|nr:ribbon-helix-helix protein, CopG family [Candidatus Woesearchaeota archaeon]